MTRPFRAAWLTLGGVAVATVIVFRLQWDAFSDNTQAAASGVLSHWGVLFVRSTVFPQLTDHFHLGPYIVMTELLLGAAVVLLGAQARSWRPRPRGRR